MLYSMGVIHFSKVRNSETLARLLVVIVLLYMLVSFASARVRLNAALAQERELEQSCALLREENAALRAEAAAAGSDEALEAMARERLGLVMPGERIYYFK